MKTKSERINDAMENFGIGLLEAKRIVEKVDIATKIESAKSVEDIKDILRLMNR